MASSNGGVPPGFRFHPTDEELLHYYLKKKVSFQKFDMEVIREVDLNKIEPWELHDRCKIGSTPQNEWYFFSHKDRKYPTGSRTNRATSAGFWKATGRDKCIRNSYKKIGMRKTLVFYRGRAPHGQKTDWIMHEYRIEDGDDPQENLNEDGWVVCRVFKKKNLFKVANEGGGGGASNGFSDQLTNQVCSFTRSRDNHLQYLLHQQNSHANQQSLDLYNKSELALTYSHLPVAAVSHHQYSHAHIQAQNFIPTHKSLGYDYPTRECESVTGSENLQYPATSEPGLEVGTTCEAPSTQSLVPGGRDDSLGDQWGMIDRVLASRQHQFGHEDACKGVRFEDANTSSMNQINQLSLRGEMDFWGYGK